MSALADPEEKLTKHLALIENSDSVGVNHENSVDEDSNEAAVRAVVEQVCQKVCDVCCTVGPNSISDRIQAVQLEATASAQSDSIAAIQHDSVKAIDESASSQHSCESIPSPVAQSTSQERFSPGANEEKTSPPVANAESDLDADTKADVEENLVQEKQSSTEVALSTNAEQLSPVKMEEESRESLNSREKEAGKQTPLQVVEAADEVLHQSELDDQSAAQQCATSAENLQPIDRSSRLINDELEPVKETIDRSMDQNSRPICSSDDACKESLEGEKPLEDQRISQSSDKALSQNSSQTVANQSIQDAGASSSNSANSEQIEVAEQQALQTEALIEETKRRKNSQVLQASPPEDQGLEVAAATSHQHNEQEQEGKFSSQNTPFAELLREQYQSSGSNSPTVELQHADVAQVDDASQKSQNQQQSDLAEPSAKLADHSEMALDSNQGSVSSESEAESQEAVLTVDNSSADEPELIQAEAAVVNVSPLEHSADNSDIGAACGAEVEATTASESDPSNTLRSDSEYMEPETVLYDALHIESDGILNEVSQLLSDMCSKVASSLQQGSKETASDSDDGDDLMSELHGGRKSGGATCAEGEVDDYMSELCGDDPLTKVAAAAADDAEADLMTELSGSGAQLSAVVAMGDESGDEADTDSKLILCTATTAAGAVGSSDVEVTAESSAEPIATASVIVDLPSTSTSAIAQTESVASATADALASIKAMAVMASAGSGSSADELAALKRRLEQLEAENRMLKESIQPATAEPAQAVVATVVTSTTSAVVSGTAASGNSGTQQHQQADSSGSPQSFSSYDSSSQNYIPAGGFLKSLSEIEESGGAVSGGCTETPSTSASSASQQQQAAPQSLESGIATIVTAAASVPASTVATAAIQAPVCSLNTGVSAAAGHIPATITPSGQIQFILPPGVLPSNFAGLAAVPQSASSVEPASVTAASTRATTTTTSSAARPTPVKPAAPAPSKSVQSTSAAGASSTSTPANRRVRTIAPKPIAMRPILPSPRTDMSAKLQPIQLPGSKIASSSAVSATATLSGASKKSKVSTSGKKPMQTVPASSTVATSALHGSVPTPMPVAMQLPSGAIAAVSQSKSLPLVVGAPIGVCGSIAPLLAGTGIPMPVNHSSAAAVWAAAPPGATFATTWAPTAPTAVVFSSGHPLSAGSLEGTALPSHDLLAIACQEAGLSLDLDLGSTVMISTSQDSATSSAPIIEGVGCDQQSEVVADLSGLVVDSQNESSFLHELGLIQPPSQDEGTAQQNTDAAVPLSSESIVQCPPQQEQKQEQAQNQTVQQQQHQECWNTTTFDEFNAALNDFNSDLVTASSDPPSSSKSLNSNRSSAPTAATKPNETVVTNSSGRESSKSAPLSVSTESVTQLASSLTGKKSHVKSKVTSPLPAPAPASSNTSKATESAPASSQAGKQPAAQSTKNTPKKKAPPASTTANKRSTPNKEREAKSGARKLQADPSGDDLELFKEIIPPKKVIHSLSENDEIEEAVKGIVGPSSLEDTITGVLKAGDASNQERAVAKDSGAKTSATGPTSPQQPASALPPSSSSNVQCQLADLSAVGDSCPVVSIPESAAVPFGDPVCLATAERPAASQEPRSGSTKKKHHQDSSSKKPPSVTDQKSSQSASSSNKRKSVESSSGSSKSNKLAPEEKSPQRKASSAAASSPKKEDSKGKAASNDGSKASKALTSPKNTVKDTKSKESQSPSRFEQQQQKSSSRSALHRHKQLAEEKTEAPASSSSSRRDSSERKQQKHSKDVRKSSEQTHEKLPKASSKSEATVEESSEITASSSKSKSLTNSSLSKKREDKKSKSNASSGSSSKQAAPAKPAKSVPPSSEPVRRSERSRSTSKLKCDDSKETLATESRRTLSVSTSESASVVGHSSSCSSKAVRASRRIAAKNVKRQSSRSAADSGRLSDVESFSSSSSSSDSDTEEIDKPAGKSKTIAKKSSEPAAASPAVSPTKTAAGGSSSSRLSRQDSDQLLYEHHPMHGEPVTSREKRLSARRARQSELELHEAVEASKVTAGFASASSSSKSKTAGSKAANSSEADKPDSKSDSKDSEVKEPSEAAPSRSQEPAPLPELKPGEEIAAALEDDSSVAEGFGLLEASGSGLRGIGDAAHFLWNRAVLGGTGGVSGSGDDPLASNSQHRRQRPLIEERSPSPPPQPSLALEIIARGGIVRPKPAAQSQQEPQLPSPLLLSSPLSTRAQQAPPPEPTPPQPPPPPPAPPKPAFVPMNLSKLEKRDAGRSKDSTPANAGSTTPSSLSGGSAGPASSGGSPIKRKFFSSDREDRRRFLFKQNFGSVGAKTSSGAGGGGSSAGGSGSGGGNSRGQFDFEPDAGGKRARRNQSEAAATAAAAAALLDLSAQKFVPPLSVSVASASQALSDAPPTADDAAAAKVPKVPKISIKPVKPDAVPAAELRQPQEAVRAASSDPQIPIKLKLKLSNQLQQQQLQQQQQQQQQQQPAGDDGKQLGRVEQAQQRPQPKLLECGSPRPMGYEEDYAQILKQKNKKREKRQHHKDKQQRKKDRRDKKKKAKSEQQQVEGQAVDAAGAKKQAELPGRVHPFLAEPSAELDQAPEEASAVSQEPLDASGVAENSAETLHRVAASRSADTVPITSQEVDAVLDRAADSKSATPAAAAPTSSASMILPKKRKIYQPGGADVSADEFAASTAFDQQQLQQIGASSKRRHLNESGSEANPAPLPSQQLPPPPPPPPLPPLPSAHGSQSQQQQQKKKKDDYRHHQSSSSVYQQQQPLLQQQQLHHHHHQHHPATPGSTGGGGGGSLNSPWGGSSGYGGGNQADPSPYGAAGLHMPAVVESSPPKSSASAAPLPPPPPPPQPSAAAVPAPFNPYEAAAAAAANTAAYGNQFLSQYDPYGLNFVYQRAQQYSSDYFGWQANHHAAVAAYGHHFPPVFPPAAAAAAATGDAYHAQHHQHHQSVVSSASAAAVAAAAAASSVSAIGDSQSGSSGKRHHHHQHGQQQQHHHQHQQQQAHSQHLHHHQQLHQQAAPQHHHAAAAAAAAAATNPYRPQDFYSQTSQLFSNFYPPAFDPRRAAGHHLNPFGGNPFP